MNTFYRTIFLLLIMGITACTSNQSTLNAGNDEEQDIGLGGTGMLANSGNGSGGTGILGEITGFGSIFVNGIEVEYDNETTFYIDGKLARHRQLEIGDVVEVLTINASKHTHAKKINLRHEVIGRVESTNSKTFSFIILGQTVIQSLNKKVLPEVGTTVAVSGFRVDEQTIISTRVTATDANQTLIRTHTELPFKEKTNRWLVQTYVKNDKAIFQLGGNTQALTVNNKKTASLKDRAGIKVLQLHKSDSVSDLILLDRVIEPGNMQRGRQTLLPKRQPTFKMLPEPIHRSMPESLQRNNQPTFRGNR